MRAVAAACTLLLVCACATPLPDIAPGQTNLAEAERDERGIWAEMEQAESELVTSGALVDDDALQTFQFFMGQMGVSSEAQNWLESGGTYIPTVEEALAYLDRWISERKSPPSDQTARPSQQLKK